MTLQPNANWLAENNDGHKQPIYAVQIAGGPEWFHDKEITSGATDDHKKRLVSISGVTQSFDPLRGEASIGTLTFELLNPGKTEIFTWFNFDELNGAKVEVRAGYKGLAWSDFVVCSPISYIQSIKSNGSNTGFIFTAQDLQKQSDKDFSISGTGYSGNVIDLWNLIMTASNPNMLGPVQGLAIPGALVDTTGAQLLRDDFYTNYQVDFPDGVTATNAKRWLQTEIYEPFALAPVILASGKISLRALLPPLYGYMEAIDRGTTLTDASILPLPSWSAEYRDIINQIIFNYDWDGSAYDTTQTYNDTASQAINGIKSMTIDSKGITTALSGAARTEEIAKRYFRKYANLPSKVKIGTFFSQRIIEAGDQLAITSGQIVNPDDGNLTTTNRVYEVESVSPDYKGGEMSFGLRDINVGVGRFFVIGPADLPDYGSATAAQKMRYGWISPSTGGDYLII